MSSGWRTSFNTLAGEKFNTLWNHGVSLPPDIRRQIREALRRLHRGDDLFLQRFALSAFLRRQGQQVERSLLQFENEPAPVVAGLPSVATAANRRSRDAARSATTRRRCGRRPRCAWGRRPYAPTASA